MKFIIVKEIGYTNDDRVVILKRDEDYFKRGDMTEVKYLCNVVIMVTKDWNYDTKFSIVYDTASIQYRPKGIFRNKKGFYYKNKGTVYLNQDEVKKMLLYMSEAWEYLNSAKKSV